MGGVDQPEQVDESLQVAECLFIRWVGGEVHEIVAEQPDLLELLNEDLAIQRPVQQREVLFSKQVLVVTEREVRG
ncbi:hypothetical protein [Asanoa sp. NPDC050611]|uniref:hypothetical protein n=1 Tax=Asanoa sp. NPDC050611 TaxID=3157098 RepID=UPI0033D1433E